MLITPRYGEALAWTDELHREQRRKGKAVPYISHLIAWKLPKGATIWRIWCTRCTKHWHRHWRVVMPAP